MNSKDNLQRALKKAFEDHKEPLYEAQWDRLSAELNTDKRSKKRFLPWFFISLGALLLAVAAGYWMGQQSPKSAILTQQDTKVVTKSQVATEDTFKIKNSTEQTTSSQGGSTPINTNDQTNTSNPSNTNGNSQIPDQTIANNNEEENNGGGNGNATSGDVSKVNGDLKKETKNDNKSKKIKHAKISGQPVFVEGSGNGNKLNTQPSKAKEKDDNDNKYSSKEKKASDPQSAIASGGKVKIDSIQPTKGNSNPSKPNEPIDPNSKQLANSIPHKDSVINNDMAGNLEDNGPKTEDSTKKNDGKKNGKNEDDNGGFKPRFAIGFSTGIGATNFKVNTITNPSKIHKDAESIFNQTTANSSGRHFNFNFEWYPIQKFPIGFAAGIQYRSIVQKFDFGYKLNQVAFRDTNENIISYIFIPDSSKPMLFHLQGRNQLNYVNIPIRLMYVMPINAKNELLFSAGINTSFMTKANGQAFSINTTQLNSLNSLYKNKFNIGWTLGLQYSYNVYKKWWLGAETQFQQNRYNYFVDYGLIRSRIKITNFNVAVRYKF